MIHKGWISIVLYYVTTLQLVSTQDIFSNVSQIFSSATSPRVARWANIAADNFFNRTCQLDNFIAANVCKELGSTLPSTMNVYFARTSSSEKLQVTIREGKLANDKHHDAVIVIDPLVNTDSPHPVLIFFLDFNTTEHHCHSKRGDYLGTGECLTYAIRKRCLHRINFEPLHHRQKRRRLPCEIHYLPIVHTPSNYENLLRCVGDIEGSAPCTNLDTKVKCWAWANNKSNC